MYYKTTSPSGQDVIILMQGDVMTSMLTDPANTDYQRFLEWVAAGGIPEPWNGA